MATIKTLVSRHPLWSYFGLTFAISWGGVLFFGRGGPAAGDQAYADPRFLFVYLAMLAGPTMAGLVMTAVRDGGAGVRDVGRRLMIWRVGLRWYLVALLTAPIISLVVSAILSAADSRFAPALFTAPDKLPLIALSLGVGLGAGIFEELGWTGFAIPTMRRSHGVFVTGTFVGALWGAWHLLAVYWGLGRGAGTVPVALFLALDLLSFLPAYRVLMVWVYDRTGSLSLAMLMHASLTAASLALGPANLNGWMTLTYLLSLAAAMWLMVAVVFAPSRERVTIIGHGSRPHRRR